MALSDLLTGLAKAALSVTSAPAAAVVAAIERAIRAGQIKQHAVTMDVFRERLNDTIRRLDAECIKRHEAEISELSVNCFLVLSTTQHDEKIRGAINILLNGCLADGDPEKLSYSELDHFARCLERLTLEAIHVLRDAVSIKRHVDVTSDAIAQHLGISVELTVGLLRQLEACDFVLLAFSSARTFGQDQHSVRVRPMAAKFVQYVLDAGNPHASAT